MPSTTHTRRTIAALTATLLTLAPLTACKQDDAGDGKSGTIIRKGDLTEFGRGICTLRHGHELQTRTKKGHQPKRVIVARREISCRKPLERLKLTVILKKRTPEYTWDPIARNTESRIPGFTKKEGTPERTVDQWVEAVIDCAQGVYRGEGYADVLPVGADEMLQGEDEDNRELVVNKEDCAV